MPTYVYRCVKHGVFEWEHSMHDDPLTEHPNCGARAIKRFTAPQIGPSVLASRVRRLRTDENFARDAPAYRSLRKAGYQPRQIAGCDELAARATDPIEIERGQILGKRMVKKIKEQQKHAQDHLDAA